MPLNIWRSLHSLTGQTPRRVIETLANEITLIVTQTSPSKSATQKPQTLTTESSSSFVEHGCMSTYPKLKWTAVYYSYTKSTMCSRIPYINTHSIPHCFHEHLNLIHMNTRYSNSGDRRRGQRVLTPSSTFGGERQNPCCFTVKYQHASYLMPSEFHSVILPPA